MNTVDSRKLELSGDQKNSSSYRDFEFSKNGLKTIFIPFFSNEAVNLCLFLTHFKTVFRGTPYFVATSLFNNPFSRPSKALHYSAKDLFVSFRFTGAIFLKKTSDEKLKAFMMYFFYQEIE